MPKSNRICKVCGTKYYYCPSCPDDRREKWHVLACSAKCHDAFNILSDEYAGRVTTVDAKKKLVSLGFNKTDIFNENIVEHALRVLNYKAKKAPAKKAKAEDSDTVSESDTENKDSELDYNE